MQAYMYCIILDTNIRNMRFIADVTAEISKFKNRSVRNFVEPLRKVRTNSLQELHVHISDDYPIIQREIVSIQANLLACCNHNREHFEPTHEIMVLIT